MIINRMNFNDTVELGDIVIRHETPYLVSYEKDLYVETESGDRILKDRSFPFLLINLCTGNVGGAYRNLQSIQTATEDIIKWSSLSIDNAGGE